MNGFIDSINYCCGLKIYRFYIGRKFRFVRSLVSFSIYTKVQFNQTVIWGWSQWTRCLILFRRKNCWIYIMREQMTIPFRNTRKNEKSFIKQCDQRYKSWNSTLYARFTCRHCTTVSFHSNKAILIDHLPNCHKISNRNTQRGLRLFFIGRSNFI